MSKESQAISMYDKVIDNSVEYVAPSAQAGAPEPAPAAQAPSEPVSQPDGGNADSVQQTPPDAPQQQPGAQQAQAGTPEYIQEIQAQLDNLNRQLAQGSSPEGQVDPNVAIDQQLAALQEQATNGEITYAEMIAQTAPLLEQRVSMRVMDNMKQESEAQQIRSAQDAFLQENPDFMQFANSPEAAAIRQANPILDNVSAYYAFKAKQSEIETSQLQQEFSTLKAQMETSIKGAAKQQGHVVGAGNSDDAGVPSLYRGDGKTPFDGGMAALRKARAAQ